MQNTLYLPLLVGAGSLRSKAEGVVFSNRAGVGLFENEAQEFIEETDPA